MTYPVYPKPHLDQFLSQGKGSKQTFNSCGVQSCSNTFFRSLARNEHVMRTMLAKKEATKRDKNFPDQSIATKTQRNERLKKKKSTVMPMKFRKVHQKIPVFWNSKWSFSSETYQRDTCDFYDENTRNKSKRQIYIL